MSYQSVFKPEIFDGKVVVVTGAGSGIGRCIAHELASLSAKVVLLGRSEDKLAAVKAEILADNNNASCEYYSVDIRDEEAVRSTVASIVQKYSTIDCLVNNAGGQFPANLEDISANGFQAVVRTNLLGTFIVTREVFNQAMKSGGGAIVSITADNVGGMPRMGHSGAARAGVDNLMKTAAVEWSRYGVRLNTVAPGYIASAGMDSYEDPEMRAKIPQFGQRIPNGRFGNESEVSSAVCFLLSDAAAYINGTCIEVDGGSSLKTYSPLYDLEAVENTTAYNGFHRAKLPDILSE